MRDVKRLWGVIGLMAVCILVLTSLLIARSRNEPEPSHPTEQPQHIETDTERAVARIGSRTITIGELRTALEHQYGAELLGQMLDREAVRLEGIEAGIQVDNAEIERELKRMQQGYESEADFYKSMKEQLGMTQEDLRADVANKLLLEKIATKNVKVSDEEVDNYIKTHPEEFRQEVDLNILQIIVSTKDQANKVLAELAKGTSFAILARDRSIDDATNNSGGELGWVEDDDPFVPAPILEAAKSLKPGETSQPVRVDNGYAVVRLKDRKEASSPDFAFVRENVRMELALQEAPSLNELVDKLRSKWGANILDTQFQ
ncbi:peptidyl-prolyl cis-trans isomerase [Paenibacillus hexagrammi]|uniref:Peptidyl-prolyl cis-trans isomerase n=1 Tax=Paenibacillus hexagrammi TaxID=2908839 RepID=A0ABY3SGD4_9BACL|nr:peptidyl-prolyl cis-trans isomerase [Paenibacillus sp. YPD9-1]UJF33098.1 peptidyl-prolyl cis-trans isomerase [Paenibacillus sp. YPD9-1]